jgi:DNA-binding FrmR family transcriptional regulator
VISGTDPTRYFGGVAQIETESEQLTNKAKILIKEQKKERALLVLKLKKHKEKEVVNIDGQLISVMEMIDTIEWEAANMEVMRALQAGNAALNKLHEEMSVEDVENLLAETNEAIETENEINLLLAGQFNAQDDEELQRELAELMGETPAQTAASVVNPTPNPIAELSSSLPELPAAPIAPVHVLPEAPTHTVEMTEDERAELAAL